MSTTPQTIDPNGIKVISSDNTQQMSITMTDATNKGLILDYDLTGTAKKFSITNSGVKWSSGATTYTTALDRLAVVQQAFQSVQLPSNSTTLQVNKTVLLTDGSNNGSIGLNSTNTEITSSGDLVLKTNNIDRVTVANNGTTTFSTLPVCSTVPTSSSQLVNKAYVDSNAASNLSNVLAAGNSAGTYNIDMNTKDIINISNVKMVPTSDSNIILEDKTTSNNNLIYPMTIPSSDFQTRLTDNIASSKLTVASLGDIGFTKTTTPYFGLSYLTPSTTIINSLLSPAISASTYTSSVFQTNNKLIYAQTSYTSKIFYLQNFADSSFSTIDLSSLTTGSGNYTSKIATLGIAQFIPVSYTSATNCKFYIRLQEDAVVNGFYIIKCDGNPALLTSYTWAIYYFTLGTAVPIGNVIANGSPVTMAATTNGQQINGGRVSICYYDSINDYFILTCNATATTNNFYTVVSADLTLYAGYLLTFPFASSVVSFFSSAVNQNSWLRVYNNSDPNVGTMQVTYWNPTTKTMYMSPFLDLTTSILSGANFINNMNWDAYMLDISTSSLGIFLPFFDNFLTTTSDLHFALFTWDKNIANNITFVRRTLSALETNTAQTYQTQYYVSVRAYTLNNIEIVSSYSDKAYISTDGFSQYTSYSSIGLKGSNTWFSNGEGDGNISGNAVPRTSLVIPQHYFLRGSGTYSSSALVSFINNSPSITTDYLNMNYNTGSQIATLSSSKNVVITANPLSLSGEVRLPTITSAPSGSDKLMIKNDITYKIPNSYASLAKTDSQLLIPANTNVDVSFNAVNYIFTGNGISFDQPTGKITFTYAGKYDVYYRLFISQSSGANQTYYTYFTDASGVVLGSGTGNNVGSNSKNIVTNRIIFTVPWVNYWITIGVRAVSIFNIISEGASTSVPGGNYGVQLTITQIE